MQRLRLAFMFALACGRATQEQQEDAPKVAPAERSPQPTAETPVAAAGPIVVALDRIPTAFDPFTTNDRWTERAIDDLLFEGLVRRAAEAPFSEPALASQCVAAQPEGPREVYCRLRDGATFHDQSPVTLDDVVYSFQQWLGPRREQLRIWHGLASLDAAEVAAPPGESGGNWIKVRFSAPHPLALEAIAAVKIVPQRLHKKGASQFAERPIGSGPMRLVSKDEGRVVFESRDEPRRSIVLRAISDAGEALVAARRGEVHIIASLDPVHIPGELLKPTMPERFAAYVLSPATFDVLVYNVRDGEQADVAVRRALDRALPRAALDRLQPLPALESSAPIDRHEPAQIDIAALSAAGWGRGGLPAWRDPAAQKAADERASAELDGAGWPRAGGLRRRGNDVLRLVVMWNGGGGRPSKIVGTIRSAWQRLGVTVFQATAHWNYIFGLMRAGKFDVGVVHLAMHSDGDPFELFHSKGAMNLSGIGDRELDGALEAFRAARSLEARRAAEARVAERLAALQPMSVLHAPTQVMLVSKRVASLEFADDLPRLDRLQLVP